jgi:hypothetical protein
MFGAQSRALEKWVEIKVQNGFSLNVSDKYVACGGGDGVIR